MIKFKRLTLRNFQSYGNNVTTVKLDFDKPTLIVGKNYDSVVDGQVDSNGAGKSTLVNVLAYCCYDKTISDIDKSDIVNYTNEKNMEASVVFEKDGTHYKIIRYRKNKAMGGDGVRLLINSKSDKFDDSHDKTPDSVANTNKEIEAILGMPFEVFSRVVIFSATFEPFLDLPSSHASKANQRDIIEELFGLTELTRKAESLKVVISASKADIRAMSEHNERVTQERGRYEAQLQSTILKRDQWTVDNKTSFADLKKSVRQLLKCDVEGIKTQLDAIEVSKSKLSVAQNAMNADNDKLYRIIAENEKVVQWANDNVTQVETIKSKLKELSRIDVDKLTKVKLLIDSMELDLATIHAALNLARKQLDTAGELESGLIKEIQSLNDNICPYCEQTFKDASEKIVSKTSLLAETKASIVNIVTEIAEHVDVMNDIQFKLDALYEVEIPTNLGTIKDQIITLTANLGMYDNAINPYTHVDTVQLVSDIETLTTVISDINYDIDDKTAALNNIDSAPYGFSYWNYTNLAALQNTIGIQSDRLVTMSEATNPFDTIVSELEDTLKNDIPKVDTKPLDAAAKMLTHQEFLLKLLTKKDSYIRKALLNKNLPYLNERLSTYLTAIGLEHKVSFNEEMGVDISKFGTVYSKGNLSAGQSARVNLALAFAFRDVLQARFDKVNFCILDECLDKSLGNVGIQLAAKMIKGVAKREQLSMFVISHKDEIAQMFDCQLEVELRDGFSNIVDSKIASTEIIK